MMKAVFYSLVGLAAVSADDFNNFKQTEAYNKPGFFNYTLYYKQDKSEENCSPDVELKYIPATQEVNLSLSSWTGSQCESLGMERSKRVGWTFPANSSFTQVQKIISEKSVSDSFKVSLGGKTSIYESCGRVQKQSLASADFRVDYSNGKFADGLIQRKEGIFFKVTGVGIIKGEGFLNSCDGPLNVPTDSKIKRKRHIRRTPKKHHREEEDMTPSGKTRNEIEQEREREEYIQANRAEWEQTPCGRPCFESRVDKEFSKRKNTPSKKVETLEEKVLRQRREYVESHREQWEQSPCGSPCWERDAKEMYPMPAKTTPVKTETPEEKVLRQRKEWVESRREQWEQSPCGSSCWERDAEKMFPMPVKAPTEKHSEPKHEMTPSGRVRYPDEGMTPSGKTEREVEEEREREGRGSRDRDDMTPSGRRSSEIENEREEYIQRHRNEWEQTPCGRPCFERELGGRFSMSPK